MSVHSTAILDNFNVQHTLEIPPNAQHDLCKPLFLLFWRQTGAKILIYLIGIPKVDPFSNSNSRPKKDNLEGLQEVDFKISHVVESGYRSVREELIGSVYSQGWAYRYIENGTERTNSVDNIRMLLLGSSNIFKQSAISSTAEVLPDFRSYSRHPWTIWTSFVPHIRLQSLTLLIH